MSANTWFEALPSDASLVAISPKDMRSHWTSIAVGLINALYWAGSGGASQLSSGELYPGATRTYLGALSTSSNGAENLGKLFLSSESSMLLLYESDRTHVLGGPGTVSHASTAHGAVWVEQRGTFSTDEGDVGTSFTTAYDVAPMVWLTASEASNGAGTGEAWLHGVLAVSTSGFTATSQRLSGVGITTVRWTSLGTKSGEF